MNERQELTAEQVALLRARVEDNRAKGWQIKTTKEFLKEQAEAAWQSERRKAWVAFVAASQSNSNNLAFSAPNATHAVWADEMLAEFDKRFAPK